MRIHALTTRPRLLAGLALLATTAIVASGLTGTADAASAALPTATYSRDSAWGSGFQGTYTVTNTMSVPLADWTVRFTLPANEHVTSVWGGTLTTSGTTYTVSNLSWNAPLAPGASTTFGFDADVSGDYAAPTGCTLNGDPCDGSSDTRPPTAPSGLTVLSTTATSVSLSWNASADNLSVAGYTIESGGATVAHAPGTVATVSGLSPSTTYHFTVAAVDEAGNSSPASGAVTATTKADTNPGGPPGVAAPFVDMGAWPTPNLTQIAERTGLRQFSLGFIVNGTQPCHATWFNAYPMSKGFERSDIESLRSIGGDVKPSFGGEAGISLAQSCTDVSSLRAQYQSVIDEYDLTQIDFDIEGSAIADPASIDRRSAAMAALQSAAAAEGRHLSITLTLPVLPSGLTAGGLNVVQSAIAHGVRIDTVNVMAMDFGDVEAPDPSGKMGQYAIDSARSLHDQLGALYPDKPDAQVWNMIGVTPMLGENDDADEVFTQADMHQLLDFARRKHLGELSFWDVTRDGNACTGSLSKCTNIPQQPYEFSTMIAPYQG